jgi:nucleoside-diphosphate-sugar epimerase
VSDIVQGIILAVEGDEGGGEVIQLGTGVETPIITLAHQVQALMPFDIELIFKPALTGEIARNYSDIGKARRLLGFNPGVKLQDGLRQTVDWFINNKPETTSG